MENNNKGYVLINLMPYREKIKAQKTKNFTILMSMFIGLSFLLIFTIYSIVSLQIESQLNRNEFISKENKKLDIDIKEIITLKEDIKQTLEKRKVVEDLQVDRSDVVNILNILSNQLPEGTSLKSLKQLDSKITIIGLTQSSNKVSNYMTNLESSQFFTKANLIEVKAIQNPIKKLNNKVSDDIMLNEFTMEVFLTPKLIQTEVPDMKNKKIKKEAL